MDATRFDTLTKGLTARTTRRQAMTGLGALALGGVGLLGLKSSAAADHRQRCHQRCNVHHDPNAKNRKSRARCHRECENRA